MQIGVVGPMAPDFFADNIVDSLRRMGHSATPLGSAHLRPKNRLIRSTATLAMQALPRLEQRLQNSIAARAVEAGCELVLNLDAHLWPDVVAQMQGYGMHVVFWFPDAVSSLGRQIMLLASYDALFFKEPHLVDRLRSTLGLPVYCLPEACNPAWHRPIGLAGVDRHIVVAGNMYPSRVRLLDRLVAKGIPLSLYGAPFPRWVGERPSAASHTGKYIARAEKARVFRSAAGVLNSMHPAEIQGVNARLFEAAGCGAAVLTEFRPTVPEHFDVGTEVLAYRDFDELVDQATRLLDEPGLTTKLGDAASRRAHRDHSYEVRLTTLLTTVS